MFKFWLITNGILLSTSQQNENNFHYSSMQCIGGSQVIDTKILQHTHAKYPINEVDIRVCLLKNICAINGTLTYYISQSTKDNVPNDFLLDGFGGNIFFTGHLRGLTLPIKSIVGSQPADIEIHSVDYVFLDANSWSYNYGHYLNDNVIPNFAASKIFNFPFRGTQQLLETYCGQFSTLESRFADNLVDYNHSMGTYRQACLAKFEGLRHHFFDYPPMYLDKMSEKRICFKNLIGGQGSTFGLRSMDLSRAIILREFRNFVIERISPPPPLQENVILVGIRTVGTAGGSLVSDLCATVKAAAVQFSSSFRVDCMIPTDLDFVSEIYEVQKAKIVISVHGTVSYMSLFARDGTQQIVIAHPKELKENQILLWGTHFHAVYLTWDRLHELKGVLQLAIQRSNTFHDQLSQH